MTRRCQRFRYAVAVDGRSQSGCVLAQNTQAAISRVAGDEGLPDYSAFSYNPHGGYAEGTTPDGRDVFIVAVVTDPKRNEAS